MPPNLSRLRRDRVRNRRQSTRIASAGIRTALAELPPAAAAQAARIPVASRARPFSAEASPTVEARASNPVQFSTGATGRLRASTQRVKGVARHEVAHLLGAGHPALSAATRGTQLPKTGVQTAQAARFETEPRLRRQRISRTRAGVSRPTSQVSAVVRPGTMRGKFMKFGSEDTERGRRLRRQSLNMALKLRKAGRDF
ncbi:hypothetical protein LCGC14_0289440 [marine sediment metagenome]|uniref:Uncharacterized protein n=1 Tax=marine sediment metagenome TaxID=412755 RepID=A0A0F9UAT8_9ZZZZ